MNTIAAALLQELHAIAGEHGVREATERDTSDPRGRYTGTSRVVLRPDSAETCARLVRRCVDAQLPIIPLGGATGLVAGHIARSAQATVLLSSERLNRVRSLSVSDRHLVAESGVVLAQVQQAAAQQQLLFPLSLASEGSCTVGGNLATNAGGVQVLRYGNTRDLVLGLEAVLPNGEVLRGLSPLRKNNTGYDLKNLLIGAEGTLGFITAASLKLFPAQREQATALCVVSTPARALALLQHVQQQLGEFISAFELISGQGLQFLRSHFPKLQQPFSSEPTWSVLLELSSSGESPIADRFERVLGTALEAELIEDALIAKSQTQRQNLWQLREHIPLANAKVGAIASFDISVPSSAIDGFIQAATTAVQRIHPALRINCFGHLGDGNLHFNIFPPPGAAAGDCSDYSGALNEQIYTLVHELDGAFSAEHGVGRDKVTQLQRYGDPAKLATMRAIKEAIDPAGLFNPGALFAQDRVPVTKRFAKT